MGRTFPTSAATPVMLENLHSITGKVRPFPADPQVSSIAPGCDRSGSGLLMDAEHAFSMLARSSQETNLKLVAVARWLTESTERGLQES